MAAEGQTPDFRFLYRQSEGTISASTWAMAAWRPLAIAGAIIAIWALLAPAPPRPLTEAELRAGAAVPALIFTVGYSFAAVLSVLAVLLLAVAEYFVCAKRLRAIGLPPSLAGLAPFLVLLAGAAHWYVARAGDSSIVAVPRIFDAVAGLACVWTVWMLGNFKKNIP